MTGTRRVAITGVGVISALGLNSAEFVESLKAGRSGIGPLDLPGLEELRFRNAALVRGYEPSAHFEEKAIDFIDRFAQFAVIAAREAVAMAGLDFTPDLQTKTAVVTGSSTGGQDTEDKGFWDLYRQNKPRVNPLTIPRVMANAGASHISIEFGLRGPAFTIATACSSSAHSLGMAMWMVRSGVAEVALAGGSEAPLSFANLKAWEAMRVVSTGICRPFSKDRSGMILGEGGAILVLEPLERARARGATVLAEISGFGMSADAGHLTQPSREGAAMAIRNALTDAGIDPGAVGYINAHGTGTLANDATEAGAIHNIFGERGSRIPVSSTKSLHGHTLGAAGAIEATATVLGLNHGFLPPTAGFTEPDPACQLDVISGEARLAKVEFALSNSFAFGGLNAVLVLRRAG